MIAHGRRNFPLPDEVGDFLGLRAVPDIVAEAENRRDILAGDIFKHCLEGLEIRMDVRKKRQPHRVSLEDSFGRYSGERKRQGSQRRKLSPG